jgi:hypothetical protein
MPKRKCASGSSGKLGELFKVQVDFYTGRLAESATLTMGGCMRFFAGWMTRFGNPPYLFTFPLSEIEHPNL